MNAKELVGKMAIRSSHVMHPNGRIDYSYTNEPIFVKNATDEYIIFTYPKGSGLDSEKLHILGREFCDENWNDYDELISGIDLLSKDPAKISDTIPEEKMKMFIVNGSDYARHGGLGAEAHIVCAKSMARAKHLFFGDEAGYQFSDLSIKEFVFPSHEGVECICKYYE